MKQATLQRTNKDSIQVLGQLIAPGLSLITLEKLLTLIAAGIYTCTYTRSNRLSKLALQNWLTKNPTLTDMDCPDSIKNYYTYELLNVPDHTGVRIHACNFSRLLEACIAPGLDFVDIDHDGEVDAISSKVAVKSLEDYMNREDFQLTIIENFTT